MPTNITEFNYDYRVTATTAGSTYINTSATATWGNVTGWLNTPNDMPNPPMYNPINLNRPQEQQQAVFDAMMVPGEDPVDAIAEEVVAVAAAKKDADTNLEAILKKRYTFFKRKIVNEVYIEEEE